MKTDTEWEEEYNRNNHLKLSDGTLIRAIQADALKSAAEMVFINARALARGDQEFAAGVLATTSNEILARAEQLEKE